MTDPFSDHKVIDSPLLFTGVCNMQDWSNGYKLSGTLDSCAQYLRIWCCCHQGFVH